MDASSELSIDATTPRKLVLVADDAVPTEEGWPSHAIPNDGKQRGPALCGQRPNKRQAWSIYQSISTTCGLCRAILKQRGQP